MTSFVKSVCAAAEMGSRGTCKYICNIFPTISLFNSPCNDIIK